MFFFDKLAILGLRKPFPAPKYLWNGSKTDIIWLMLRIDCVSIQIRFINFAAVIYANVNEFDVERLSPMSIN